MAEIVLPQLSTNVPAFLAKLWKMVDDPLKDHLISWGPMGNTFVIHNQADFSRELLPFYYKHNNMASFVRQLNMYGFHKVVGVEAGGLKSENDQEMEFSHNYFIKGQEVLLGQIKRKVSANKAVAAGAVNSFVPSIKNEKVTEVLSEVAQLKDKQEDMDSKLDTMKKENEALWREVINLRHKHTNQQKIVNKLIHFLMGCLQGGIQTGHGVKRRFQTLQPLAIESRSPNKQAKLDIPGTSSSQGPVILDVTNDQMVAQAAAVPTVVPAAQVPTTQSPQMDTLAQAMQAVDPTLVNPAISLRTPIKNENNPGNRPALKRELSREDFDADTFQMQTEIDNLKDILSGQITLDSSLISNLFNPNEPLMTMNFNQDNNSSGGTGGATLPIEMETSAEEANKIIDQQLDQPSLFELADEYENELMGPPATTMSNTNDFASLETPLLTDDSLDTNPLLAQITSQRTSGKKQKF